MPGENVIHARTMRPFHAVLILSGLAPFAAWAAVDVSSFLGTYKCSQLLRTAPSVQQSNAVLVKVTKLAADRVRLTWSEPNVGETSVETGELGNGIAAGDLEYRSMVPAPNSVPGLPTASINDLLVSFSKTPAGKALNLSVNRPKLGIVATACMKK